MAAVNETTQRKEPAFELWMLAHFALGMAQITLFPIIIIRYVTDVTANPANAGIIMAIVGLAALIAPVIGRVADQYMAHRLILFLGVLAMGIGFVGFAVPTNGATLLYALSSLIFGLGLATVTTLGPAIIVGSPFSKSLIAKRLTAYNILFPAGQLVGGVIMVIIAGLSYPNQSWVAFGVLAFLAVIVWFSAGKATSRIVKRESVQPQPIKEGQQPPKRAKIFTANFGILLLMLVVGGIGFTTIVGQVANVMNFTFGMAERTTSAVLAIVGIANMGLYVVAGRWLLRSGGLATFRGAYFLHVSGLIGLTIASFFVPISIIIPAFFLFIFYLGEPFGRIPQPVLAVRYSPMEASTANGWVVGAISGAAFLAGIISGYLAQSIGFNAVLYMATGVFILALLIQLFGVWPVERRLQAEEKAKAAAVIQETSAVEPKKPAGVR
jgi:predicted MFS family arabinose efflux permease